MINFRKIIAIAGVCTSAANPAFAFLDCTTLQDNTARLACYDDIAGFKPATETATAAADPVKTPIPADIASKWHLETETSAITDTATVFLSVKSTEDVQCRPYGQSSGPLTLYARCLENTTALLIVGDCQFASGFGGYGEVTFRTDKDKANTLNMQESTNSQSIGFWTGGRAIPAIQSLFGKERLTVRVTPFGMSPVEAVFDIAGLEDASKPLREACEW